MKKGIRLLAALLFCVLILVVWFTRRDFNEPSMRIFTEMAFSPAYGPQSNNPVLSNGQTLRTPPRGTIARGYMPISYTNTEADLERAANELANPLDSTYDVLIGGRQVFEQRVGHRKLLIYARRHGRYPYGSDFHARGRSSRPTADLRRSVSHGNR